MFIRYSTSGLRLVYLSLYCNFRRKMESMFLTVMVLVALGTLVAGQYKFGSISGAVRDARSNSPLSNVNVRVPLWAATHKTDPAVVSRLKGQIRTDDNWVSLYTTTDARGTYDFTLPVQQNAPVVNYSVEFTSTNYNPTTISNVDVRADTQTYVEELSYIDRNIVGRGNMEGVIKDAQTNQGVVGVEMRIRNGSGLPTGPVLQTVYSGANGVWRATNLETGNYVAECSKAGYSDLTRSGLLVLGGANVPTTGNQNMLITAKPAAGTMRIVLSWGAQPRDLDSHLTVPLSNGGRSHVFYSSRGSKVALPWADLDQDVVTSFGPETVTITKHLTGMYRYSVHDYSNQQSPSSRAMSTSKATIDVYWEGSVRLFNVPQNLPATLWTVFEMTNGVITPINQMSHHQNSATVP